MTPVRLVLAHPAPLLRASLRCLFERHDVEVVAEAADVRETERRLQEALPDVVLADAALLAPPLQTPKPAPGLVALTPTSDERERVAALVAAGVTAFVCLLDEAPAALDAVRSAAARREVWVSPRVAARLLDDASAASATGLGVRDRELLSLVAAGVPGPQIAARLHLAQGTVRNRLSALYARLGVSSRAEAVAWAWRHGLAGAHVPRGGSALAR